jgi:predicted DNA-binding transcriptional regulator AlpA
MQTDETLIRLPQVLNLLPISRSTFWSWVKSGKAPAPVKLSAGVTCWRKRDILAMIETAGEKVAA